MPGSQVRVLVVTTFDTPVGEGAGEAFRWIRRRVMDAPIPVPGLCPDHPAVLGGAPGVWLLTTGMGAANAAASVTALATSGILDLRRAYILVAGIAGIAPDRGTLGSPVWTDHAVSGSLAHELDAREMPADWPHGFVPLGARRPGEQPLRHVGGEAFALNRRLCRAARDITRDVPLADDRAAEASRARYPEPAARQAPSILTGATLSSDTVWSGRLLSDRARRWVTQYTDGRGEYTTTQMEDNAILTAVGRARGPLDPNRVAILRCGANFDQAPPDCDPASAFDDRSGWTIAAENAYRVGSAFADHVVENWTDWRDGVPDYAAAKVGA